ncbi:hypothetical protein E2C01_040361 [Portunus trituberculatus]|uniref:Uncharacterized protein n=1 Tax=Portunus trituberculatus TaxID=210409 RepID=A0A5B7FMT6_PORTR|nr:hypothetical protein [Portunus trituberculatus]
MFLPNRTVSTSAARYVDDLTVKQVEPKSAHKTLMTSEEESHEKAVSGYITIDTPVGHVNILSLSHILRELSSWCRC